MVKDGKWETLDWKGRSGVPDALHIDPQWMNKQVIDYSQSGHPDLWRFGSCNLRERTGRYDIGYAAVQKNVGPAGVQIVIIKNDLIRDDLPSWCPTMLKYKTHADNDSLYNTPPAYGIYICGLVFKWLKKIGGLEKMKKINEQKAKILYDF